MAVQQILTPKMFLHSLTVEQFLHVKYFEFYSQLMIVKNLSEIPLWFFQWLFFFWLAANRPKKEKKSDDELSRVKVIMFKFQNNIPSMRVVM